MTATPEHTPTRLEYGQLAISVVDQYEGMDLWKAECIEHEGHVGHFTARKGAPEEHLINCMNAVLDVQPEPTRRERRAAKRLGRR